MNPLQFCEIPGVMMKKCTCNEREGTQLHIWSNVWDQFATSPHCEQLSLTLEMDKPKVSSKGDSFIKLLDYDFSKQLQIPHDFTKTFDGNLPHRFFVETSMTKTCWRVEVEEDGDGNIYLRDGWDAFAEAHCLEVGNILLFECEEQSIFQVKIYDRNGCEKNVIVNSKESQPNPPKVIDIEEETLSPKKTEEETHDASFDCEPEILRKSRPQRTRTLSVIKPEILRKSRPQRTTPSVIKDNNGIIKKQHGILKTVKRGSNVGVNKTSFSVFLAKEYQFTQLAIPMAVNYEKNLASKDEVVLQDATGKCWPVRLAHKRSGYAILSSGWKDFLIANNIDFGDTLNIGFVSDKLAQVHVTKSSEPVDHPNEAKRRCKGTKPFHMDNERGMPQGNHATKEQTVEALIPTEEAESHELNCSSFSFQWSKGRASNYLYIPKAIAKENRLKNKESVALRDTDGKYWPLEVKIWNNGNVALTNGWSDLWKGLAIKDGDTLKFEFVSHRRIQLSIHKCERPHATNTENGTTEGTYIKGCFNDLLDLTDDMEVMDIKGFDNDLLASTQDHCSLQTPPGFKPKEHHLL